MKVEIEKRYGVSNARRLNSAALKAIAELNLPCEVAAVFAVPDHAEWCIRFTPAYGQLSVSMRNEDGFSFPEERIIEMIKTHLNQQDDIRARQSER